MNRLTDMIENNIISPGKSLTTKLQGIFKYFRNWMILIYDMSGSYLISGHLIYPLLYKTAQLLRKVQKDGNHKERSVFFDIITPLSQV